MKNTDFQSLFWEAHFFGNEQQNQITQRLCKKNLSNGMLTLYYEVKMRVSVQNVFFLLYDIVFLPFLWSVLLTDRLPMQNKRITWVLETSAFIWEIFGASKLIMLEWQEYFSSVRPQGVEKNDISTLYMINVFPHGVMVTIFWSKPVCLLRRENYLSWFVTFSMHPGIQNIPALYHI